MATISPYAFVQELDNDGTPLSGGKIYTYDAGTSTPKATFTDSDENTQNTNPIILDANGRAEIWLDTGNYKFVLRDENDVLIKEVDNIAGQSTGGVVSYFLSTNTSITELYDRANIYVTGATTLTLLPAADATDGFEFWVYNEGVDVVTIDPDGAETINNTAAFTLNAGEWAKISCDGNEWYAFAFLISTDELIKVSADDTTSGFLSDKLTVGDTLSLTENNGGGNETLVLDTRVASETQAREGTATTKLMHAKNVADAIDEQVPLTNFDEDDGYAYAENTAVAIPHNLGAIPKLFDVVLKCVTAEKGYSVGDELKVFATEPNTGSSRPITIVAVASNVTVITRTAIQIPTKTGGSTTTITLANWEFAARVWG